VKKVNPRHKPATQADVNKAKKDATNEAIRITLALVLTCLRDKEGWGKVRIKRLWDEIESLSDSIRMRYVSLDDLLKVLEEDGYELRLKL
jgi:hypothetical protein